MVKMSEYKLWPEIKPFEEDYLKVSEIHEIRYALYGNPNGEPVFFLEDEEILKNTDEINEIPITLINGTRDVICPPVLAWRLHQRLSNSELNLLDDAGHLSSDPKIQQALLGALNKWIPC